MSNLYKQDTGDGLGVGSQGDPSPAPLGRPRQKDLLRTTVTILVGTEPRQDKYVPHAELLCHWSPFFKAAITGKFEEAETGVIKLPNDEPRVFDIFQDWLYNNSNKAVLNLGPFDAGDVSLLLALWVFGDKYQVPGFQNAAMEALRTRTINEPRIFRLKDIQFAFGNTLDESPLRKFIVDLYVWEGAIGESIGKFLEEAYPNAFITGVVQGYTTQFARPSPKTVKNNRPYASNATRYYIHDHDGPNIPGRAAHIGPTAKMV
ncbi:MAG: hypothetical protein Q9218_000681 [Villophora microphyllina]